MAEPAHAQLGEHQPGLEPTGNVNAGVDDAGTRRERANAHAQVVGARDVSIGERPRPLVHPELTHSTSLTLRDHEDTRILRIFVVSVIFVHSRRE